MKKGFRNYEVKLVIYLEFHLNCILIILIINVNIRYFMLKYLYEN